MKLIKNQSGKTIARLMETSNYRHDITDASGRMLGYYNPKLDKTFDRSGALVGNGDQRMILVNQSWKNLSSTLDIIIRCGKLQMLVRVTVIVLVVTV